MLQEMDEFVVWFVLCRGYEDISWHTFWECWLNHRTMSLTEHKNWVRHGQKYSAIAYGEEFLLSSMERESHSMPIDSNDGGRTKYKVTDNHHGHSIHDTRNDYDQNVCYFDQAVKMRLH